MNSIKIVITGNGDPQQFSHLIGLLSASRHVPLDQYGNADFMAHIEYADEPRPQCAAEDAAPQIDMFRPHPACEPEAPDAVQDRDDELLQEYYDELGEGAKDPSQSLLELEVRVLKAFHELRRTIDHNASTSNELAEDVVRQQRRIDIVSESTAKLIGMVDPVGAAAVGMKVRSW